MRLSALPALALALSLTAGCTSHSRPARSGAAATGTAASPSPPAPRVAAATPAVALPLIDLTATPTGLAPAGLAAASPPSTRAPASATLPPGPPAPPPPPASPGAASTQADGPIALIQSGVRLMYTTFVRPLDAAQLYTEAWQGATAALTSAGIANLPATPAFPQDVGAAATVFAHSFPDLQRAAAGKLTDRALVDAALKELAARRNDCHTYYLPPAEAQRATARLAGEAKQLVGVQFSTNAPLRLTAVTPGSAAASAGMRQGQRILAVNGVPVGTKTPDEALQPVQARNAAGQPSTFTVQDGGGTPFDATLTPAAAPLVFQAVLPGNIGYLRFDAFAFNPDQYDQIRAALTAFEAQGIKGWIVDLRYNAGGNPPDKIAGLFAQTPTLWGAVRRDGSVDEHATTGELFGVPRPLVFLIGKASFSGSEVLPAALQELGRASVVGEQTTGCLGEGREEKLADGSILQITDAEVVIGPNNLHLSGSGVVPDLVVPSDPNATTDTQVQAAIRLVQQLGAR